MKFFFLVIAFGLLTSATQAQTKTYTVNLNCASKLTKLQTGTYKYLQYYTDSLGQVLRVNSIKTRIIKEDPSNGDLYLVIQRYNKTKGNEVDTDTAFIKKSDFRPLAYHTDIQSAGYKEIVQFTKDSVYTTIFYKDSTTSASYVSSPDYFISTTMEDIMSILPLMKGFTILIKNINPGVRHSVVDYKISVVRMEKVQLSDHSFKDAILVEAGYPTSKSYSQYWFSVDKQLLLKHSFKMRDGSFFIVERLMP